MTLPYCAFSVQDLHHLAPYRHELCRANQTKGPVFTEPFVLYIFTSHIYWHEENSPVCAGIDPTFRRSVNELVWSLCIWFRIIFTYFPDPLLHVTFFPGVRKPFCQNVSEHTMPLTRYGFRSENAEKAGKILPPSLLVTCNLLLDGFRLNYRREFNEA